MSKVIILGAGENPFTRHIDILNIIEKEPIIGKPNINESIIGKPIINESSKVIDQNILIKDYSHIINMNNQHVNNMYLSRRERRKLLRNELHKN